MHTDRLGLFVVYEYMVYYNLYKTTSKQKTLAYTKTLFYTTHTILLSAFEVYQNTIIALVPLCDAEIGFEIPVKIDLIVLCIAADAANPRGLNAWNDMVIHE